MECLKLTWLSQHRQNRFLGLLELTRATEATWDKPMPILVIKLMANDLRAERITRMTPGARMAIATSFCLYTRPSQLHFTAFSNDHR
jgi:hypothetical protein